jgi:hypothetical protein
MSSMMLSTNSAFAASNSFPKTKVDFHIRFHQSMPSNISDQQESFNSKNTQDWNIQNNNTQVNNSQIDNTQLNTSQYGNAKPIVNLLPEVFFTSDQEDAINNAFVQQNVTTGQAVLFDTQGRFILSIPPEPNVTTNQAVIVTPQNVTTGQAAFFDFQGDFILPIPTQTNVTTNQAVIVTPQNKQEPILEILDRLVAAGTITSNQEITIEAALKRSK